MKRTSFLTAFSALILALCFSACSMPFEPPAEASSAEGDTVKLRVSASTAARSVLPEVYDIASYELWGTKSGGEEYRIDWSYDLKRWEGSEGPSIEIPVGQWNFTLSGVDEENHYIYEGALKNISITKTYSGTLNFTLSPLKRGDGNVFLYVEFPDDSGITEVITTIDGRELDPPLELVTDPEDSVTWFVLDDTFEAGDYLISFALKNAKGKTIAVISEIVVVRGSAESSKQIVLTKDDINTAPKTPQDLYAEVVSVSGGTGTIQFTWTNVSNTVTGFVLNNGAQNYTVTSGGLSEYTLNSASLSGSYKIKAVNDFDESPWSASVQALPGIPANVTAAPDSDTSITVTWDAVTIADGYYVYGSTSSDGTYSKITDTPVTTTSYTNTGLASQTTAYYYKVSATINSTEGNLSNSTSATTMPAPPTIGSPLTMGQWENNSITSDSQYYYFYAVQGTAYMVRWNDSYEGDGTKNVDIKVSAYWYTDNGSIFSQIDSGYTTGQTFTASKSGYVILKAMPYNSSSSGTYSIIIDDNSVDTVPTIGSSLTMGQWENNSIASGFQYYYFYAVQGTAYMVRWNDSYDGDGTKNVDIKVSAYWYTDNGSIFSETDSGYTAGQTFTASKSGYVILKAMPYSSSSGTYAVIYNTYY